MVSYYVGERLHFDAENDPEAGIPVVDADGNETYVLPEEFDYFGQPERDVMIFKAQDLDEIQGEA